MLYKICNAIGQTVLFLLLTGLTQVGGLVYLVNRLGYRFIESRTLKPWYRHGAKFGSFIFLYSLISFVLVPLLARPLGRVPLPMTTTNHLRPLTVWTCILNRNYIRPQLRDMIYETAAGMDGRYPGTVVSYLDASFPFIDGFGLLPHLSHNDGRKLDLSFCYNNAHTGQQTNMAPSAIGYGICEEPREGEENTAMRCAVAGYWQYSTLRHIVPQGRKMDFSFSEERTRALVQLLADKVQTEKIFIEPHLKNRLDLTSSKIRFHGCRAVRHDDHIHVQVR